MLEICPFRFFVWTLRDDAFTDWSEVMGLLGDKLKARFFGLFDCLTVRIGFFFIIFNMIFLRPGRLR